MCNCCAANEVSIHNLLRCRLYSVQRAELLNGVYKLDSTLHNSSEDQLRTVLLYGSEKFDLTVNIEIIRLTVSYLKASELFFFSTPFLTNNICIFSIFLFLFTIHFCYSFVSFCTGLIVNDYILLEFCVLFRAQF